MRELLDAIAKKEYYEGKTLKVLIIEDNPNINLLLKINLMNMGNFVIETCLGPKEGIEKYFSYRPDLMIVDVNLPDMNGFKFYEMMKVGKGSVCPTLFISANHAYANQVSKLDTSNVAFVPKPFEYEEIRSNLMKIFAT